MSSLQYASPPSAASAAIRAAAGRRRGRPASEPGRSRASRRCARWPERAPCRAEDPHPHSSDRRIRPATTGTAARRLCSARGPAGCRLASPSGPNGRARRVSARRATYRACAASSTGLARRSRRGAPERDSPEQRMHPEAGPRRHRPARAGVVAARSGRGSCRSVTASPSASAWIHGVMRGVRSTLLGQRCAAVQRPIAPRTSASR